ncbi:MAG: hypothetical protein V4726_18750 [Verrucomicrobiota bacterium]
MNPIFKGILFVGVSAALVGFAMDSQVGKEQEQLRQSLTDTRARLRILDKEVENARQRRIKLQGEVGNLGDLDKKHSENMTAIPQEQKKAEELLVKFKAADADRAAAVLAVRENEKKAVPRTMTLKDNSKLEKFVLSNISDDDVLTVEHANGLMKLTADRLTPDYSKRLGLGWKPVPPVAPELKPQEKVLVSVAQQSALKKLTPEEKAEIKKLESLSVSEQLTKLETELGKAQNALEEAKRDMRALDIRKSDAKVKGGTGQTYGDLKVAAGARVTLLAKKITTLQGQRRGLQKQLDGIKTDGY